MKFALLSRPRTQAILDGTLQAHGAAIQWLSVTAPLGWQPPAGEEHRSLSSGQFDGGEMSISSFVEARAQGAPILALPLFLKRGLVQRSLFCAADSTLVSPAQLQGKRVGLVHTTSSMATWMRGTLAQDYRLPRSGPTWFTLTPTDAADRSNARVLEVPREFCAPQVKACEELDGYSHPLEGPEAFLLSRLETRELDAVISYQTRIVARGIRPLLIDDELLGSHGWQSGVYPINHIFVVRESIFDEFPGIGEILLSILRESRKLWLNYLPQNQREPMEQELARLGYDPFAYRLGDMEKRALETFVGFLLEEKRITRRLTVTELLHPNFIEA